MALFRPFQELSPFFRMLDDYAVASARQGFPATSQSIRSFQPRFDVRETKEAYELQGDLPGIASKDVNVQWEDNQTLTISGHSERHSETKPTEEVTTPPSTKFQASVEDSQDEPATPGTTTPATAASEVGTEVTQPANQEATVPTNDEPKYWLSERSYGKFSRTWTFPSRVDTDNVKASLKDGILSIVIPKASSFQPKKINVE